MIAPPAPVDRSDGDSDSDWDDDDDYGVKKINIKIKPIAQVTPNKISASVDELRASVGTWKSLANINLTKPNSRRHHQSTVQLNNLNVNPQQQQQQRQQEPNKLPVAFAVQECLNARLLKKDGSGKNGSIANIIGHVKMAVPPEIMNTSFLSSSSSSSSSSSLSLMSTGLMTSSEHNLEVTLVTSIPWDQVRLNSEFVCELEHKNIQAQPFLSSSSTKKLLIDMQAVKVHIQKQYQKQPNSKYFILPELLNYTIGSQQQLDKRQELFMSNNASDVPMTNVNPLNALSHWLCDLTITKFKVDIQLVEKTLEDFGLSSNDIRNLKISVHINGGVISYQSKPEANWNPLDSRLTWSFDTISKLVERSTTNGVTSCLARFELSDGPSTPSDVNLQFSISGKTVSGSHVILNGTKNFRLATQKYEVKTGTFACC